jgi:hypothetical protein
MAKPSNPETITVNPMFKLLLWINAILCVVTAGAFIGLLGGRAAAPDPKQK